MEQQWIPSLAPTNTSSTHTDRIFQIGLSSVQGVQVRGINSLQFTKLSLSGLQFPRNNKSSPFPFPQNTHSTIVPWLGMGRWRQMWQRAKFSCTGRTGPHLLLRGYYSQSLGSK